MSRPVSRAIAFHVLVQVSHITVISGLCITITTAEKEVESATFPLKTVHPDLRHHITSVHILLSHTYTQESVEAASF